MFAFLLLTVTGEPIRQSKNRKDVNMVTSSFLYVRFESQRRDRSRPFFHHFTMAIDTNNIRFVFNAVKDTILHENLHQLMLQ